MAMITDKGIEELNKLSEEDGSGILFCPEDLQESYPYAYALAKCVGWTEEQIADALRFIQNKCDIEGARAGTTLRQIITMLSEQTDNMVQVLDKYKIKYDDINPKKKSFFDIVDTIAKSKMGAREMFYLFNCTGVGLEFIDIVYSYRHEIYREE